MFDFIAFPIGHFLKFIYQVLAFENYGISIILLTVIIKTLLLPLYIKQYSSTSKMSVIQPQMQEIQKKYKNDSGKLNEEMMKLYKENNVNPAGGCLPLLIQMPILFSLYYVISQPLKYMFGMTTPVIEQLFNKIPAGADRIANMRDLSIINYFTKHIDKLSDVSNLLKKDQLLNMNFLGLNLGSVPTLNFHQMNTQNLCLLLIPIVSAITTYISIKYSSPQPPQAGNNQSQASMQKSMTIFSPLMTAFISFSVPAGMGIYWITSNVYQIVQQAFMNRYIIKKKPTPVPSPNIKPEAKFGKNKKQAELSKKTM